MDNRNFFGSFYFFPFFIAIKLTSTHGHNRAILECFAAQLDGWSKYDTITCLELDWRCQHKPLSFSLSPTIAMLPGAKLPNLSFDTPPMEFCATMVCNVKHPPRHLLNCLLKYRQLLIDKKSRELPQVNPCCFKPTGIWSPCRCLPFAQVVSHDSPIFPLITWMCPGTELRWLLLWYFKLTALIFMDAVEQGDKPYGEPAWVQSTRDKSTEQTLQIRQ